MNHNKNQAKKSSASRGQCSQQVRIIGGEWKRTPLTVIDAEGLRPTPDRVRETVFNWIHHLSGGNWQNLHCLDLFAGSGALGFEAASRGAADVLMVEAYTPAFRQLEENKAKLKADAIQLQRGDALIVSNSLVKRQQRFEVIFLDPPFNQGLLEKILPVCVELLAEHGLLYVEAEQALPLSSAMRESESLPTWCVGWDVVRQDKAGSVYFHLLQRNKEVGKIPQNLG